MHDLDNLVRDIKEVGGACSVPDLHDISTAKHKEG